MRAAHSKSLLLMWQLTELEAKRLGAEELEPAHFLIGLAKAVDVDWIGAVNKDVIGREAILEEVLREMRILRDELDRLGLEPKRLRRRLRSVLARQDEKKNGGKLRRNMEARRAFKLAEKLAALANSAVYPKHLLDGIAASVSETLLDLLRGIGFKTEPLLKSDGSAGQRLGIATLGRGAGLN